jgi:6-methylpretetramide 4-monooxygenase / 4-hydroxy-6-methylpretetramide 12a-monooxygenase
VPPQQTDVLVIGAGPSGLFATLELARHGVRARLVEREPRPHDQARATVIQPGTLEILARAEIAQRFLDAAEHLGCARVFDADLNMVGEVSFTGAGCRWEYQCSLPQSRTEQILSKRLQELGGVVERGVDARSVEATDGGVAVELGRADGSIERTEVGWVLGAGGAHSLTRASMDELLTGETYPGNAVVADVRVAADLPRDGSALIATPQGYMLLGPLPGGRWITFVGDLDDDESRRLEDESPLHIVAAAIARRLGTRVQLEDIAWASAFRMHRRLVSRMANEHRFLLGDAGHLSSPFGGEGLNAGLHDAHNLAWKLALVLQGRGRPGLVESFASERLSADVHILDVSDRLHRFAKGAVQSARTGVRPSPPTPDQVRALVRSRTMLDASYPRSPLSGECRGPASDASSPPDPGDRYPDRLLLSGTRHHLLLFGGTDQETLSALLRRWQGLVDMHRDIGDPRRAGLPAEGAILVRPDGHIGFRACPADAAGLRALDAHLDSYLIAGPPDEPAPGAFVSDRSIEA